MKPNSHRENKEYMLEWIVNYTDTITKEEHHDYMNRYFKTIWTAREYANELDEHCSDIRIYELFEEFEDEEE